ncbi:MAG: hypothetical protein R2828_35480 [Saprospiraceae bacterium]
MRQERNIASLRAEQTDAIAHFLSTKFTNAELYDWMSDILEEVYSFFLQQATATAQLAAQQLAFERQEPVPAIILSDYWQTPVPHRDQTGEATDRRGLTGSARLLQDIYQLDQFALQSDRRKLQLSKTISLSQLAPAAFQQLREDGKIVFHTPGNLFDRDFPGHYLRLIKKVSVSVIALAPPIEGIKASLLNSGISRVVLPSQEGFSTLEIKRAPESIAFNGTINATGLFEMQANTANKLLPFESMGVDTAWELSLPKGSNPQLNYDTIGDILIHIEYTSLESDTYKEQVIRALDNTYQAQHAFSFRNEFPDQWYELHHPELLAEADRMRAPFKIDRSAFPANISELQIKEAMLYFSHAGALPPIEVRLQLNDNETASRTMIDGKLATQQDNSSELWDTLLGQNPAGDWELILPDEAPIHDLFRNNQIKDILLILSIEGKLGAY